MADEPQEVQGALGGSDEDVDVGGRLGREIKGRGGYFELGNLFTGDMGAYLGSDRFGEVYFRTDSGNIYRLDERGRLTNKQRSQKRGVEDVFQITDDEIRDLQNKRLEIGKRFFYAGGKGGTTNIVEIVAVTSGMPDQSLLASITKGKKSNIAEDFWAGMPHSSGVQGS